MKKINIFFIHFLIFANMCKMVLFVSFKIPFYFADCIMALLLLVTRHLEAIQQWC